MTYQDVLDRVLLEMPKTHPSTSKFPNIAVPLAREIAYLEWRRHRMFDHTDIVPGAQMPDGEMGYALCFFEGRDVTGAAIPSRRVVSLSRDEMQELRDKIDEELKKP